MKDLPSWNVASFAEPHVKPIYTIGRINASRGIERFDMGLTPSPTFYNPSLVIKQNIEYRFPINTVAF